MKVMQYAGIFHKNRMLLVRYSDYVAYMKDMWFLPGGHVEESDKNPVSAIKREVLEETGLKIKNVKIFCLQTRKYYDKEMRFIVYYTANISGSTNVRLSSEHTAYEWVEMKDLKRKKFISKKSSEAVRMLVKAGRRS
ncbi:NUDIX hydrolase [archaeon]|nr:NUDIX hydrolase [archaeon]